MNLTLTFPDLLLFGASIVLSLTIILLFRRINTNNGIFIITLSLYFAMVLALCYWVIFFHLKLTTTKTVIFFIAFVLSSQNVLHYLCIRYLILKTNLFKVKNLIHFVPVLLIMLVVLFFFDPVFSSKGKNITSLYETQNLLLTYKNNYIFGIIRLLHPAIYLVLGGRLVYAFYKSTPITPGTKSIRRFIYFLYFQKIILMFWFLVGLFGFKYNFELYSNIAIIGFSLSALLTSTYVLLNPDLSVQITKLNPDQKKLTERSSDLPNLIEQLNSLMNINQLYLNSEYNLTNLSSDSGISPNSIREIITAHGFKNYSAYINSFRIDHAKYLIQNGYLETYSIESLSKDSGFQSDVTFYRVFKKIHHFTPKEYSFSLKNV